MDLGRSQRSLALVLLCLSCTSTEERFDSAEQLAAQGRFDEAAGEYIRVLDKDPDFPGAREGLEYAGTEALALLLDEARQAEADGLFAMASAILDRLDRLHGQARGVGVQLPLPADYADFRAGIDDSATFELLELAEGQADAGRWSEAIRTLDRARGVARGEAQRRAVDELAAEVFIGWGEAEMSDGHYRAASGRFESALDLLPEGHYTAEAAFALRERAFELGTAWVAFLPLYVVEEGGAAPTGFGRGLSDALLFDYWSRPPLFLGQVDPGAQGRVLRREELDRDPPGLIEASRMGDILEADFVVLVEMVRFTEEERNARRSRREATMEEVRRRTTRDTAYVEVSATIRMTAEVAYTIIDPYLRREVGDGTYSRSASGQVEWGEFAGNPESLNLSSRARDLFDPALIRAQRRDIEEELIDEVAEAIADRVFDRILTRIP